MKKSIGMFLLISVLLSACAPSIEKLTAIPTVESQPTPNPNTAQVILTWQRDGGIAGFCDGLSINSEWIYQVTDCKQAESLSGKLTPSQLELLQNAIKQYAAFDTLSSDGAVADSMSIRTTFNGQGNTLANEEIQKALSDMAAEIASSAHLIATPDAQRDEANVALRDYLIALNQGDYIFAAKLYGGDTSLLETWNPDADKNNLPKLLELACLQNGLQCMPPLMITYKAPDPRGGYQFLVEFALPDGSLFHQGLCCGDESTGPFPSQFLFTVLKINDLWQVQDLPPYMP